MILDSTGRECPACHRSFPCPAAEVRARREYRVKMWLVFFLAVALGLVLSRYIQL